MRDSGFTLIELLIVVTIIGILASLAIPNYSLFKINAFNRTAESDVRNLAPAAEIVFENNTVSDSVFSLTGSGGPLTPDVPGGTHSSGVFGTVTLDRSDNSYLITAEHLKGSTCYTFDSEAGWTYTDGAC